MAPPRLFLSHSSQDADLTASVAAELRRPGPAGHEGFEVLVDADALKAGEEWPSQLHSMMAYAQAGLLLFTPAAMTRPAWVRKEAYILTWRRSLDPSFKVFYALLDGVTSDDLTKKEFDPAHLRLIQSLASKTPDAIAEEVKRLCPSVADVQTPFEELVTKLGQHLNVLGDPQLQLLAKKLGAPPARWKLAGVRPEMEAIAARILVGDLGNLKQMTALINELRSLAIFDKPLAQILRWAAPYWLPPETSGRLGAVAHDLWLDEEDTRGNGWATINGRVVASYTAERLAQKALPFRFDLRVAGIEGPANRADADFHTEQICDWLRKKMPDDYDGDNDAVMARLRADRPFLFVPIKLPDEDTLTTLRARFPNVVFLLWTGEQLTATGYTVPVVPLEPEIDLMREETEYTEFRGAQRAMRG